MNDENSQDAKQEMLKAFTRSHIRYLWDNRENAGTFGNEDTQLIKTMKQHPEYQHIWEHADELTDAEIEKDGTNPILHVQFHATVENQIRLKDPKEVAQVVKLLVEKKYTRHEAIHAVANILAEEVFGIMTEKRPFNREKYLKQLRKLVR
ncbi:MAG: DUF1841 family protein [Chloroflexi bacterium]|nr:MAG: DUF1841 family protein [Chloroflexota bacterium]